MIEERLLLASRQINPLGTVQTLGHSLHKGNQTLQTPYAELWEMIELLPSDFDYPWLMAISHRDQFSIYSMNP